MTNESRRYYSPLLAFLLLACIACLWIPLLRESFWIDETVTAFAIRAGAGLSHLAAGPRLDQTIYYWLPRMSQAILGFSEFSLRLPSLAVTLVSLRLIGRLAARSIHRDVGWVAVFLCFIPHEFTRQATDARPYGLGTCPRACAAFWFLVRWLDQGGWRDAVLFLAFAALLIRVHLIYWPFYAVFVGVYRDPARWRSRTKLPVSRACVTRGPARHSDRCVSCAAHPADSANLFHDAKMRTSSYPPMPPLNDYFERIPDPNYCSVGRCMASGSPRAYASPGRKRANQEVFPSRASGTVLFLSWWLWPARRVC